MPDAGWDYTALSAVVSDPFITAADLSKVIIDKYVTQTGSNRPRTLASVSREGFDYFVLAFRLLLTELNDLLDKIPYGDSVAVYSTLAKVRSSSGMVAMEWERQQPGIDLGTLLHQLQLNMGDIPRVQALVQSALKAYQEMVVHHTAPPEEPGNTGMAIYFPKTAADMDTIDAEWSVITPPFGQMDSITIWLVFLQKYYAAAATCRSGCTALPDPARNPSPPPPRPPPPSPILSPGETASKPPPPRPPPPSPKPPPYPDSDLNFNPSTASMESLTISGSWIEDVYGSDWPGFYRLIGDVDSPYVSSATVVFGYDDTSTGQTVMQSSTDAALTYPSDGVTRVTGEHEGVVIGLSDTYIEDANSPLPSGTVFAPVFTHQEYRYADLNNDGIVDEELVTYTAAVRYTAAESATATDCDLVYLYNYSAAEAGEFDSDYTPEDSNDPGCSAAGCPASWQGDGWCDSLCLNSACDQDSGDCEACLVEGCDVAKLGDGACDSACDNPACHSDFGDCGEEAGGVDADTNDAECTAAGCPAFWQGDGYCDEVCEIEECEYDRGDCHVEDSDSDAEVEDSNDPACTAVGCPTFWQGDDWCDIQCYVAECAYDSGDCAGSALADCVAGACTAEMLADWGCPEACDVAACEEFTYGCSDDGYYFNDEVDDSNAPACSEAGCPANWQGDDYCDPACYIAECSYDSGDCLACLQQGCQEDQLLNEECDLICDISTCGFDFGYCYEGASAPGLLLREGGPFSADSAHRRNGEWNERVE
ncbi:hypothetical protein CYMTET_13900 [Cymbomonas tetramitiformis]|uniref:LNR domain-containing protein n=1 Tax=Cymbomonas tetramitiformis TaxID=36881 RepID=A0AAE0GHL2_9CHLO|nr:hypothetical protein CYMTET_13900 [Cymbomonas tetramitiformis]